jgi:hypothetical protein
MKTLFYKLIRFLFLVKEIVSQEGVVHFRRYRLISLPFLNLYVHQLLHSDMDAHMHDHPWNFDSFILFGSYLEQASYPRKKWIGKDITSAKQEGMSLAIHSGKYSAGDLISHTRNDVHRITLLTPVVWTLVLTTGFKSEWGYQTKEGWIQHQEYRKLKNEGKLSW